MAISSQNEEKLTIKFDFESFWKGHAHDIVLLDRYGYLAQIVTIPINQMLVQKIYAYTHRKQTLPRDIYDIVWLLSQGAVLDKKFMKENNIHDTLIQRAQDKYAEERKKLAGFRAKLKPFLLYEQYSDKLDMFEAMLYKLR